jgi:hypothetical protein
LKQAWFEGELLIKLRSVTVEKYIGDQELFQLQPRRSWKGGEKTRS